MELMDSHQRYKKQLELAKRFAQLVDTPEWGALCEEMEKELHRLVQLTEDAGFVEKASANPILIADNFSFRRGIRYVIDFPTRAIATGRAAAEKLAEYEASEAPDQPANPR